MVFIIDELDRCKPTFSLELLERVKHFFSVRNCHFLLGVHVDQLCNSIAYCNGKEVNSQQYLHKFISLTLTPHRNLESHEPVEIDRYIRHLKEQMEFPKRYAEQMHFFVEHIVMLGRNFQFSLRTIEKLMSMAALGLASCRSNFSLHPPIFVGLCILKLFHYPLYEKAKLKTLQYVEIE